MKRLTRRHRLPILVSTLVGGLLVTLYFMVFGVETSTLDSAGADSFSRSALGHHALVAFLQASGTPVLRSRGGSADKTREKVPLLVLEPAATGTLEQFQSMIKSAKHDGVSALVALPKWHGEEREDHAGWLAKVTLLPARQPGWVLAKLLDVLEDSAPTTPNSKTSDGKTPDGKTPDGETEDGREDDRHEDATPRSDAPSYERWIKRPGHAVTWPAPWGDAIDLAQPQLIAEGLLEPVLATGEGVLAGWLPQSHVLIISDPDLLNNAGLAKGRNAALVEHLLIETLGAEGFVLDEVLHGHGENIHRALLRFPFICLTLHALWLALLVAWRAAMGRFGRPLPLPPRVPPGKQTLIDNTAQLLATGRRGRGALMRYLEAMLRRASRRAGLVPAATCRQQAATLGRLARARGARRDIVALAARCLEPGPERLNLGIARDIHTWFEETFHGTR